MERHADVVIIGASSSGSSACMPANLGRRALNLESEQFPRFSGENLLPHCVAFMEEAVILRRVEEKGFQRRDGAVFSHAGRQAEFDFSGKSSPGCSAACQVPKAQSDEVPVDAAAGNSFSTALRSR